MAVCGSLVPAAPGDLYRRYMHIDGREAEQRGQSVSPLGRQVHRMHVVHDSQQPISPSPTIAALAYCLAAVGVISLVSLILFYAIELTEPPPHVFGPLSDITGAAWNLLLVPLVIGIGSGVLPVAACQRILVVTAAASGVAAVGSALLVVRVLPFEMSTAISVAALMVQAGWLVAVGAGLRRSPGWQLLGRGGRAIGIGTWAGAILFAASLPFGWGSPAQVVVMVAGLVPGLLAWMLWPAWVFLLARRLSVQRQTPILINHRGVS